jgi:hypothetical protein
MRDGNREWRRPENDEFHRLYRSPNIVRVIKSRSLKCGGHIARMEKIRNTFIILIGQPIGN